MNKNMRIYPVLEDEKEKYDILKNNNFKFQEQMLAESKLTVPGVGELVTEKELEELRKCIITSVSASGYPYTQPADDIVKSSLDKRIGELLYTKMNITPSVAATLPMWYFLNIVLLPDVVYWRWGDSPDHFVSIRRNYLGTQWWRYYLFSKNKQTLKVYTTLSDGEIADLYERSRSKGLPNHISEFAEWFEQLDECNATNSRDLFRSVIKLYNSEFSYRLYFTLSEDEKKEIFTQCVKKALSDKIN